MSHVVNVQIKEYGYREDGLKYWAAVRKYTRGILDIYYESDQDVKADSEVQAWLLDVKVSGIPYSNIS